MDACLDDNELAELAEGIVARAELPRVERHLDGCASCRALLRALTGGAPRTAAELARELIPASFLPVGTALGPYRVEEIVGRGGMGVVYRAFDTRLRRVVAVKVFSRDGGFDDAAVLAEARAMATVEHPHVVPVFDWGREDAVSFVVMEFIEGTTLRDVSQQPFPTRARLLHQVALGLQYAHDQGVVHGDVKPDNVLVDARGCARVTDFGLARSLLPTGPIDTETPAVAGGTPGYVAPEIVEGGSSGTHRSDQYALCVTVVEVLTGVRPLGANPSEALQCLPGRLARVMRKGLERDPQRRHRSLLPVLSALEAAARPPRRTLWLAATLAVGALAVAASDADAPALRASAQVAPTLEARIAFYDRISEAAQMGATGRAAEGMQRLQLLFWEALEAGVDDQAAYAATVLAKEMSVHETDPELALDWARHARSALERIDAGPEARSRLHDALGLVHARFGSPAQAKRDHEAALALARELPSPFYAAMPLTNLGSLAYQRGDFQRALELNREALEIRETSCVEGACDLDIAQSLHNIGGCLQALDRSAQALEPLEEAYGMRRSAAQGHTRELVSTAMNLGVVSKDLGDNAAAQRWFRAAIEHAEVVYGTDHWMTAVGWLNLSSVERDQGRLSTALEWNRRARDGLAGSKTPYTAIAWLNAADILLDLGELEEAKSKLEEGRRRMLEVQPEHPYLALFDYARARLLVAQGRVGDGMAAYGAAESKAIERLASEHGLRQQARLSFAKLLARASETAHARVVAERILEFADDAQLRSEAQGIIGSTAAGR